MDLLDILVAVDNGAAFLPADDVDGDVGAVVGDAFDVGQDFQEDQAGVDGTLAALEALDVAVTALRLWAGEERCL